MCCADEKRPVFTDENCLERAIAYLRQKRYNECMNMKRTYPLLMVDVVLLTLIGGRLHVGLAQRRNPDEPYHRAWTLPGGMVRPEEDQDAEDTARRVLRDKAGVVSPYLEQLYTFTGALRDSRGWSASIAYYALVPAAVASKDVAYFKWEVVDEARSLPFDHSRILATALERVRSKTSYSALPLHLAPPVFTLAQLREVYEQVLGGELPHRTFERRMEELDILEPTEKPKDQTGKATRGKPAQHYRRKAGRAAAQLGSTLIAR